MRQKIVAGNWKMNKNAETATALVNELLANSFPDDVRVMIAPPSVFLDRLVEQTRGTALEVVSQNMHAAVDGAFTGEISSDMLKSLDVHTTLLGHSERRAYNNETDNSLSEKTASASAAGMEMVFCFGEELADRKAGKHFDVVRYQLEKALFEVPDLNWDKVILAYEPVWAIGTGETASPEQAQEMHAYIRSLLAKKGSAAIASETSILYGGSVKPSNARELFSQTDVDGGLIGGAALHAADFNSIIDAI